MRRMIGLLALLAPIAACGGEGETQAAEPARNITVFELSESTPEIACPQTTGAFDYHFFLNLTAAATATAGNGTGNSSSVSSCP